MGNAHGTVHAHVQKRQKRGKGRTPRSFSCHGYKMKSRCGNYCPKFASSHRSFHITIHYYVHIKFLFMNTIETTTTKNTKQVEWEWCYCTVSIAMTECQFIEWVRRQPPKTPINRQTLPCSNPFQNLAWKLRSESHF